MTATGAFIGFYTASDGRERFAPMSHNEEPLGTERDTWEEAEACIAQWNRVYRQTRRSPVDWNGDSGTWEVSRGAL